MIMTYNHSHTVRVAFSPIKIIPKYPEHQNCVCRLAALKAHQALFGKFPKTQNYEFNKGKICIFIQTQLQYITTN